MSVHRGIGGFLVTEAEPSDSAPQEPPGLLNPPSLCCALFSDPCVAAAGHAGEAPPALAPLWARQARAAQVGAITWAPQLRGCI